MRDQGIERERILIVDDERQVRDVLCDVLGENYRCTQADSAEEALTILTDEHFELVMSDINLGGMSGLEMLPHVRAVAPNTVVMMITGEQTIDNAIEALRAGAYDYILKPLDFRQVEVAVRRALDHHSLVAAKGLHDNHLEVLVEQRAAELEYLAFHDALTNLPNRILFQDRLTQALVLAQREGQKLAMVSLALDRFKKVHDTLGHTTGCQLLKNVAERLTNSAQKGTTVARFEGDEFALLLTQTGGIGGRDVVKTIYEINEALKPPFTLDGHEVVITVSMGISLYPEDGADPVTLLKNASAALYRAKEKGGNNYQFYTADMTAKALKRLTLENDLRQGLDRDEIRVYYQPKMNIDSGDVVGMEALVRWQHPELGLIAPADFIPLAEDTGLIEPLGEQVLRTACTQSKKWQDQGFKPLLLSVNLSARQFQQKDLLRIVERILAETKLDSRYLELELTESSIMRDAKAAVKTLDKLKEMGVRISIDDFGTGYSSLAYLKSLPIDVLKIDSSFVRDVTTDMDDAELVKAIISLAHNLRLKVIAEGVETEEQLRILQSYRCDEWQGFLFSKPIPAAAFGLLQSKGHLTYQEAAYAPSSNSWT